MITDKKYHEGKLPYAITDKQIMRVKFKDSKIDFISIYFIYKAIRCFWKEYSVIFLKISPPQGLPSFCRCKRLPGYYH